MKCDICLDTNISELYDAEGIDGNHYEVCETCQDITLEQKSNINIKKQFGEDTDVTY